MAQCAFNTGNRRYTFLNDLRSLFPPRGLLVNFLTEQMGFYTKPRRKAKRSLRFETLETRVVFAFTCPDFRNPMPNDSDNNPCDNGEQSNGDSNGNAGGDLPDSSSSNPVNYFNGLPQTVTTDLRSYGFGETFGITRTWSDLNNTGPFGNGWIVTQNPYLVNFSTYGTGDPTLVMIGSGQSNVLFDVPSLPTTGNWPARSYGHQKVAFNTTTSEWTMTDATGNKLVFYDLPRDGAGDLSTSAAYPNQATYGKLKNRIDTNGLVTNYTYDVSGQLTTVERSITATGQADRLTYGYSTISNTLGASATLATSVTLSQRDTTGGPFNPVRSSVYTYYTGEGSDAAHGRIGDLKLVTIRQGSTSGAVIEQKYYRYYKLWGSDGYTSNGPTNNYLTTGGTDVTYPQASVPFANAIFSGLRSVVQGESFQRLVANFPSYESATDTQLKVYADNFYEYERWGDGSWGSEVYGSNAFDLYYHHHTRHRVSKEFSQPLGNGSLAAYHFEVHVSQNIAGGSNAGLDPNVWRVRTTEYLPDSTSTLADNDRTLVFTNERGQVLLRNHVDVSEDVRSVSSFTTSSLFFFDVDVTVTSNAHGLVTGDSIALRGATSIEGYKRPTYDGVFKVTVVDANTFIYRTHGIRGDISQPTAASMSWAKALNQTIDYYRYREQVSTYEAAAPDVGYGQLVAHAYPSAVSGYDQGYSNLVTDNNNREPTNNHQYIYDDRGRIDVFTYYAATTATPTVAGGVNTYRNQTLVKRGELDGGTLLTGGVLLDSRNYFSRTVGSDTIYPLASMTNYRNTDGTGAETTSYAYTFFASTNRIQSLATSLPIATTAQNGSNAADVSTVVYDLYDRPIWTRDADGFLTFTQYDMKTGAVIKTIQDVQTTQTATFTDLPSGWVTPSGGGLHLTSTFVVDNLGRTTKATDPKGNVTFNVYKDISFERRTYRGWNATTGTTTGPIEVHRQYRPISGAVAGQRTVYEESLTTSAAPTTTGAAGALVPTGNETITAANIQSLTREVTNDAGQLISTLAYFSMAGVTYSSAIATLGTASNNSSSGNYHATLTAYDSRGRLSRVEDATGTITRTLYDSRSYVNATWVGTDDTPTSGTWSPANNVGANMAQTVGYLYDDGNQGGDGNLTQISRIPGGSEASRTTKIFYDYRNRPVTSKLAVETTETEASNAHPISYVQYDNVDRAISEMTYDGDTVTNLSLYDLSGDGVPDQPASARLRSRTDHSYDNQSRLFRSSTYSIDQTTGVVSTNALKTDRWFNKRGDLIKLQMPEAAVTKFAYDGVGRTTIQYHSDAGGDTTWAHAGNVTGDFVVDQTQWTYDANSNIILVQERDRFHNMTGTGALGLRTSTTVASRSSFEAFYYDAADRLTAIVDVGTNAGNVYTRPATVPVRSDTVLVTSYVYGVDGRLLSTTDPKAIVERCTYDFLGRKTKSVENYINDVPAANDDQTVQYTYNGASQTLTTSAILPSSAIQTTAYVYGASTARGDFYHDNRIRIATNYPDPTTGAASASQQDSYTVNGLGETRTMTDRNGNVHAFERDVLGRMTSDTATTLGAGVDGAVRRIGFTYNTQGQIEKLTSYSDTAGTTVASEILRQYNGLQQLTTEFQSAAGAVNVLTTPKVLYAYSEMAAAVNHSRLVSITYPNGRVITSNYVTGIDNNTSRLTALTDSSGMLESYTYIGLGTIVNRSLSAAGMDQTKIKIGAEANGDSQDPYTGIDRFGRVINQRWLKTSNSTNLDRYGYGYDRNDNRTYRENLLSATNSELYAYDNLDRVTSFQRGTLNAGKTALSGAATRSQTWSLDALGNSNSVTTDSVVQNRTHNRQNELTQLGATNLAFDNNGNLITDQNAKTLRYDAWNRMVEQRTGATSNIVFAYDALNRRIKEGTTVVYFNAAWQAIEERSGTGTLQVQYTWSAAYIDAMITRDKDTDANGITDQRHYVMQDANWNVTGLVDATGAVVQRFQYDAYGKRTVLSATWSASADTFQFAHGFAGGKANAVTGRLHFRHREYDVDLMRWTTMDPIGFQAGDMNWYQYVGAGPTIASDPSGLIPFGAWGGHVTNNTSSPITYAVDADSSNSAFWKGVLNKTILPDGYKFDVGGWAYHVLPPGESTPHGVDADFIWHQDRWVKLPQRSYRDDRIVVNSDGSVDLSTPIRSDEVGGKSTLDLRDKKPYVPPTPPANETPNDGNPPPKLPGEKNFPPPPNKKPVGNGKPTGKCVTVKNPFVT